MAGPPLRPEIAQMVARDRQKLLDRYGHLYPSDVDAVGTAIDSLLR